MTTYDYDSPAFRAAFRAYALHGTAEEFLDFVLRIPSFTEVDTPVDLMPLGAIDMELSDRTRPTAAEILLSEPSEHPRCPVWSEVEDLKHELERDVR